LTTQGNKKATYTIVKTINLDGFKSTKLMVGDTWIEHVTPAV
jgi:hypothetical protein